MNPITAPTRTATGSTLIHIVTENITRSTIIYYAIIFHIFTTNNMESKKDQRGTSVCPEPVILRSEPRESSKNSVVIIVIFNFRFIGSFSHKFDNSSSF
jgi:hypothetical protein